jgi:hypothetical protein
MPDDDYHHVPVPIRADTAPTRVTAEFDDCTVVYGDVVDYRPKTPAIPAMAIYATREVTHNE